MSRGAPAGMRISFGGPLTPVVRVLIWINVVVYLCLQLTALSPKAVQELLGLTPQLVIGSRAIWQPLTYMFLHGQGMLHIIFNMLLLFWLGSELERLWGGQRFLRFYLAAGVFAGLCVVAVDPHSTVVTIGASGALMALLLVYACLFPNREFLFMFILPIKAKYLILMIMVIEIFSATDSVNDMISHTAHLGGCAFGLLWFLYLTGGLRFRALRRLWRRRRGRGRLKLVGKGKAGEPVPLDDEELPPTIH